MSDNSSIEVNTSQNSANTNQIAAIDGIEQTESLTHSTPSISLPDPKRRRFRSPLPSTNTSFSSAASSTNSVTSSALLEATLVHEMSDPHTLTHMTSHATGSIPSSPTSSTSSIPFAPSPPPFAPNPPSHPSRAHTWPLACTPPHTVSPTSQRRFTTWLHEIYLSHTARHEQIPLGIMTGMSLLNDELLGLAGVREREPWQMSWRSGGSVRRVAKIRTWPIVEKGPRGRRFEFGF